MNIIVLLKTVKYVYAQTGAEIEKNYISEDDIINILNPHDRRIVHIALREDDRLDTRSRGEGVLKKVVIVPKN